MKLKKIKAKIIKSGFMSMSIGVASITGISSLYGVPQSSQSSINLSGDDIVESTIEVWDKKLPSKLIYEKNDGTFTTNFEKAKGYEESKPRTPAILPEANKDSVIMIDGQEVRPTEIKMYSEDELYLLKGGGFTKYTTDVTKAEGYSEQEPKIETKILLSISNTFVIPGLAGQKFDPNLITLSNIEGRPGVYAISYYGVLIKVRKYTPGITEVVFRSDEDLLGAQLEIRETADSTFFDQFANNSPGTFQPGQTGKAGYVPSPVDPWMPDYLKLLNGNKISILKDGVTTYHSEITKYVWENNLNLYLTNGSDQSIFNYTTIKDKPAFIPEPITVDKLIETAKNNSNKNVIIDNITYTRIEKTVNIIKENLPIVNGIGNPVDNDFGVANFYDKQRTLSEHSNQIEVDKRILTGAPYAPHYHTRDIAEWNIKNDVDAQFLTSTEPLHIRESSIEGNLISENKSEGRVFYMDTFRDHTSNSPLGTKTNGSSDAQIMDTLQYVTDWVYFGGSAGEGTIYIPRPQDISALHKMGVKVHATLFFPPYFYGGRKEEYTDIFHNDKYSFEFIANQMVKMAKAYGFDGWFINDETYPGSEISNKWFQFMKVFTDIAHNNDIEVSYYMSGGGWIRNRSDIKNYDYWFNDYGFSSNTFEGINEIHSPTGYQVFSPSNINNVIKGASGKSIWFFFEQKEARAFENEQNIIQLINGNSIITDPRNANNGGLAYWYKEYTTILDNENFKTNFNDGNGEIFNINGVNQINNWKNGYSRLSLQHLLPTWRYIVDTYNSNGEKIVNNINYSIIESNNAWFGSNVLNIKGTLSEGNSSISKLYASNLSISSGNTFKISYVNKNNNNIDLNLSLWVMEDGNISQITIKPDHQTFNNNIITSEYDISALQGKIITSFGIEIENASNDVDLDVLEMSLMVEKEKENIISNVHSLGEWQNQENGKDNIRLSWNQTQNGSKYFIYSLDDSEELNQLLEITDVPAVYLQNININEKIGIISYSDNWIKNGEFKFQLQLPDFNVKLTQLRTADLIVKLTELTNSIDITTSYKEFFDEINLVKDDINASQLNELFIKYNLSLLPESIGITSSTAGDNKYYQQMILNIRNSNDNINIITLIDGLDKIYGVGGARLLSEIKQLFSDNYQA